MGEIARPKDTEVSSPALIGTNLSRRAYRLMKDEWNENLRCPTCGKTGIASLCQDEDADKPTVICVPSGFKIVADEYGPDFHCETCNVAVLL
jgi:hypothetical protein